MSEEVSTETRKDDESRSDCDVKLAATKAVLAIRERELLDLKGPCSSRHCRLHYAHSGPCDFPSEDPR